ncbi:hypothetical protein ACFSE1_12225 [Rhizobium helianthi]|uniref:Sigma-like protein n=1 Tax=Rhizobium helianthi TaxID=1132695 RepID=A0ABW4M7N1_9HYPH
MNEDKNAQTAVEQPTGKATPDHSTPAAGPHAREQLTDHEKTPGTGSLPDKNQGEADVGSD